MFIKKLWESSGREAAEHQKERFLHKIWCSFTKVCEYTWAFGHYEAQTPQCAPSDMNYQTSSYLHHLTELKTRRKLKWFWHSKHPVSVKLGVTEGSSSRVQICKGMAVRMAYKIWRRSNKFYQVNWLEVVYFPPKTTWINGESSDLLVKAPGLSGACLSFNQQIQH